MSRRPAPPRARPRVTAVATATARRQESRFGSRAGRPRASSTRPAMRSTTPRATPAEGDEEHADEARTRRLARLISVRAMVLGIVLLVGFTILFPTVRAYLGQQAELDALAADVVAAEEREEELAAELARWQDDAYVAAQARERLRFVLPGETPYRVIDPEVVVEVPLVEGTAATPNAGPTLPVGGAVTPWYTTIWDSVRIAGESAVPDEDEVELP